MKVLVVEDDADNLAALAEYLKESGHEVALAEDGQEGLALFESESPDIALLDFQLPRMSGADICRAIRKQSDIPVVMFTGVTRRGDVLQAIDSGATDYILKLNGVEGLLRRISRYLTERQDEPEQVLALPDSQSDLPELVENDSPAEVSGPRLHTRKTGPAVVVADGDKRMRAGWMAQLEALDYSPIGVATGVEAAVVIEKTEPAAVLLPTELPDTTGYAVLRHLASEGAAWQTAFIVTGPSSPEARRKALFHGASAYLSPPVSTARLGAAIESSIKRTKRRVHLLVAEGRLRSSRAA